MVAKAFLFVCAVLSVLLFIFLARLPTESTEFSALYGINGLGNSSSYLPTDLDEMFDFSHCGDKMSISVAKSDHPLSEALSLHPSAVDDKQHACLRIVVTDFAQFSSEDISSAESWGLPADVSPNIVVVNLSPEEPYSPTRNEIVVQPHFSYRKFRPQLDFAVHTDVAEFNETSWEDHSQILPLRRKFLFAIVGETAPRLDWVKYVNCDSACEEEFRDATFCFLVSNSNLQQQLLSSIRVGCIPVIGSLRHPLPFEGLLDWKRALFRFPKGRAIDKIFDTLQNVEKEEILEMRRMCRIFANRLENADALAETLVAALADRMQLALPTRAEVNHFNTTIIPAITANETTLPFERIPSKFKNTPAFGTYSYKRWNSGRALRYAPTTAIDTPMLPMDSHYFNGTKETMVGAIGTQGGAFSKRLGLTRDLEQFTVVLLTYNRDASLAMVLNRLNDCPYLNKVIIVWNNLERSPNYTWPTIHVPIEFIFPDRNSLLNRFLPFEAIETEAVVSLDDDQEFNHNELVFAFRAWREHRDRLVGFPERYTYMKAGSGRYGLSGRCEYSVILTGFAFMHKEFLHEFTYNQHPFILKHIDENRNCEDLAMNFLVSHLSRQPPLRIVKRTPSENRAARRTRGGLSGKKSHYTTRSGCVQLFTEIYGYNPLLQSQHQATPMNGGCAG